jgi:hypothetical protein
MRCNEAWWDRGLRLIVGAVLLSEAARGHPWGFAGLLQIVTGATGYCVLYERLGITTKKVSRDIKNPAGGL